MNVHFLCARMDETDFFFLSRLTANTNIITAFIDATCVNLIMTLNFIRVRKVVKTVYNRK